MRHLYTFFIKLHFIVIVSIITSTSDGDIKSSFLSLFSMSSLDLDVISEDEFNNITNSTQVVVLTE